MPYEEPGVQVIQQLQAAAANVQDATQALTLVGELYEVFEDQAATLRYDAVTGAGVQAFSWPSKKATSVVDLQGVRKDIAEVDSQLNENAPFPLGFKLRDPSTQATVVIDPLTDVTAISQSTFSVVEGSSAATARASGTDASSAVNRSFHIEAAGLLAAGLVTGDRVRLTNGTFDVIGDAVSVSDDTVTFTPDGHDMTIDTAVAATDTTVVASVPAGEAVTLPASGRLFLGSGSTFEIVQYDSVAVVGDQHTFTLNAQTEAAFAHAVGEAVAVEVLDVAATTLSDVDLASTSGFLDSATGGLTGAEGSRVTFWVEEEQANDATAAGTSVVLDYGSLAVTAADVGKRVALWSDAVADGATNTGGGTISTDVTTGDTFTVGAGTPFVTGQDEGKLIELDGVIHRITAVDSTTAVKITPAGAVGAVTDSNLLAQVNREIMSVNTTAGTLTVDGADLNAVTNVPVVLLRPVRRQLVTDTANTDNSMRYSGSAISSDTGFLAQMRVELRNADLTYEVFPAYELLVTFRALDIDSVDQELVVYQASDLSGLGGTESSNPLVWAANNALNAMGTTDQPVILLPVNLYPNAVSGSETGYPEDRDEAVGYSEALGILALNSAAYFLVPLTRNTTVRDAFVAHIDAMSEPEEKNERCCFLTYALPMGGFESVTGGIEPGLEAGNKKLLDPGQNLLSGAQITVGDEVVITAPAAYAGTYTVGVGSTEDELVLTGNNWLQTAVNGTFDATALEFTDEAADTSTPGEVLSATANQFKDVQAGDFIVHNGETRRVVSVGANGGTAYGRIVYSGGNLSTLAAAQTVSILRSSSDVEYYAKPLTKDQQASALATISSTRANRRVVHLWPDQTQQITGTDDSGNEVRTFVPSYFAAAAEAGRLSVLPPQRSSTGAALPGFTDLRHANKYFNRAQLNVIAGGGWSILEQRTAGAAVVMRHLLTTDLSTVKTQELSFTKNVDNMAKRTRAAMEPLLNDDNGRVNISDDFLAGLAFPFRGIFEQFVSDDQLVKTSAAEPFVILSIEQDPNNPDTILATVELNVPLPANKVKVTFVI